jgi:hypothetical protein
VTAEIESAIEFVEGKIYGECKAANTTPKSNSFSDRGQERACGFTSA